MAAKDPADLHAEFERALDGAVALATGVTGVPHLRRNKVYEGALLQCLVAWEALLEGCFIGFLCERPARSGSAVTSILDAGPLTRAGKQPDQRAFLLLRGDSSRNYLDWLDPDLIKDRSALWFPDESRFATARGAFVHGNRNHLRDMIVVRNHIAHRSKKSEAAFDELRRALHPLASERHGMGPGQFLSRGLAGGKTRLGEYVGSLRNAADLLTA